MTVEERLAHVKEAKERAINFCQKQALSKGYLAECYERLNAPSEFFQHAVDFLVEATDIIVTDDVASPDDRAVPANVRQSSMNRKAENSVCRVNDVDEAVPANVRRSPR